MSARQVLREYVQYLAQDRRTNTQGEADHICDLADQMITEAIAATREADAMIAFRYAEGSANPQTKYVAAMVGEAIRKAQPTTGGTE